MNEIPITRARLFVLIDAFERDIRSILQKYVVDEAGENVALGNLYSVAQAKREGDPDSTHVPLVQFLELREGYNLLNTHRKRLPVELAKEVKDATPGLSRIFGVRNRVMHARPFAVGDGDTAVSLLTQFQTPYWRELRRVLAHLHADPAWEPSIGPLHDESAVLHNLPLPDYDDTGLVGRANEVDQIVSLLKRGREPVVTIIGEGGIGKTALAVEVAYRLVDDPEFPFEAVLWTTLKFETLTAYGVRQISGAVRDMIGAVRPIGSAIDSSFSGTIEELADLLDGFKVLLIIDNLETVAGEEFRTLYNTLPDTVTYLITSRLGVGEYERRFPLGPLGDKESLHLFSQFVRARRIQSLYRLSEDARVQVVRQLRFSPLAIKWFALAVEAGRDPIALIRRQDELLEFCVRSVYQDLSEAAQEVLVALAVLARPVTSDELVVLLDRTTDAVSEGVQELVRGSLVRREGAGGAALTFQLVLTETATQFLSRRVQPDENLRRKLELRDKEFREVQERRATDLASRSLAPVVVRQREDSDAPACTVLRQALLLAKKRDNAAYERIDLARKLAPDFWEVDRVEGFIRDSFGDLAAATSCYERAYDLASGEDRAVVAHFFAGHLARKVRDVSRAVTYAREANDTLDTADTRLALGTYLVWSRDFESGLGFLESAVPVSSGKTRVIAISALAEGWRRYAEFAGESERNVLYQYDRAWKGFEVAAAALESGIADLRLIDTAVESATISLWGAANCLRASMRLPTLGERLAHLEKVSVRMVGTRKWTNLVNEVARLAVVRGAPGAAKRLHDYMRSLESAESGMEDSPGATEVLIGEIVSLMEKYGFIRHPRFPENVFFHAGDVVAENGIAALNRGMLVRFSAEIGDRGPKAIAVQPA